MSCSTVEHFSHPQHQLVLKQDVVIRVNAKCSVCDKSVIGSPAYTCTNDDVDCRKFYLHKSCSELPKEIIRDKQDLHPLTLVHDNTICDDCYSSVNFSYACDTCEFHVCVICAFISSTFDSAQKVIRHEGHSEHTLTLIQRQALFKCDACWEKANDYSYVCLPCDFWIHRKCAFSPPVIPAPTYHHHPLTLIFSIPVMHRYFEQYCHICKKRVQSLCWSYYCHKCTFFVHIECSTSTISMGDEIEENGCVDDEPDLVQFPLPDEDSQFDLIITQCLYQLKIQGEEEMIINDPHIIKEHWSHSDHPLELHQVTFCESEIELHDNDNDSDDDRRVLICDGCIKPITFSQGSYYACIQCRFFLHAFCATKLPQELLIGVCPFHPKHFFVLGHYHRFYDFFVCGICGYNSNGFYYKCDICDFRIDIRCAFWPTRIRHKSHKQHSLVQRPFSNSKCSASNFIISGGLVYGCETCRSFEIHILCAFYPSSLKHRYDDHPISLQHPTFFYEGVIYCEICEERVNNQWLLYHCDKCDHSFHHICLRSLENVKLGGTIKHSIGNQQHTLALVLKRDLRKEISTYFCGICGAGYKHQYFFECNGCGYLACIFCIRSLKSSHAN